MTVSVPAPPPVQDRRILAGGSALVTGAGPAGVATARALASAGASVALAGEDDLALLRTARAIEAAGGRAVPLPADLRESGALRLVVASAKESFGVLDLAVNTIGAVDGPRSDVHTGWSAADFAAVAVWLCSDRAAQVTGAAIAAGLRPARAAQPTQPGRTTPYS